MHLTKSLHIAPPSPAGAVRCMSTSHRPRQPAQSGSGQVHIVRRVRKSRLPNDTSTPNKLAHDAVKQL